MKGLNPSPSAPPVVLVDCGHIRNAHSGLGQVACQYARALLSAAEGEFAFRFLAHPRFREFRALAGEIGAECVAPRFSPAGAFMRLFNKEWKRYAYGGTAHSVRHILHRNCYRIPPADRAPVVLTVHDMHFLEEEKEQIAPALARLQELVRRAAVVGFISEYARRVAGEHLDFGEAEQHVIHNGVEKPARPQKPEWFGALPRGRENPPAPFLLSIAQIAPGKNFRILPAMMKKLPGMNLIIAGKRGGKKQACAREVEKAARREGVAARVVLPGAVGESEKAWLLQNCAAFVFPSLREGFGMPVVEAMHFGKPVFCFRNTALPEVGGEHAFYWRGDSPQAMAELIQTVLASEKPEAAVARKQWAATFSWQNNAAAYLTIYRRLAQ